MIELQMNWDDEQWIALKISILIGIMARLSARAMEETLNAHHIPLGHLQFAILHMLNHQPMTQRELSRRFWLDPSTLVATLKTLVRKGYVRRGIDPTDRRRVPLSITDEGRELLVDVPAYGWGIAGSINTLSKAKKEQLLNLLWEVIEQTPDGAAVLREMGERIDAHRGHAPDEC